MSHADPDDSSDSDFYANAIADHVNQHIGPITNVFHEIQSDIVQIDVLVVGPQENRPFTTLVTCGISDRPMRIPIEDPDDLARVPELRFAELLVCLPPDWPLSPEDFQKEENYWPVRWLKRLARLPHLHDGWFGLGHTIPNGDPPRPFAGNTRFCCWLIDQPLLISDTARKLRVKEKAINLYSIVPLYQEEMAIKLQSGARMLSKLLDDVEVSELIDLDRRSAAPSGTA